MITTTTVKAVHRGTPEEVIAKHIANGWMNRHSGNRRVAYLTHSQIPGVVLTVMS